MTCRSDNPPPGAVPGGASSNYHEGLMTMKTNLIGDLLDAHTEIERVDPPGNHYADHPAYVLTLLTAVVLRERQGAENPMDRDKLIKFIAGSCRSILKGMMVDGLPPDQMMIVGDAVAALEPFAPKSKRAA